MMNLYDINGSIITNNISNKDIKDALLSAVASGEVNLGNSVGATLSLNGLNSDWQTNAETVYKNLLTNYKKMPNKSIPIFITTDQHGRGIEGNRFINNIDKDGMEITNINLGDTVTDVFNLEQLNTLLARSKSIKNYIAVPGNHEYKHGSEVMTNYDICRTFISSYNQQMCPNYPNCYTAIDGKHNVKYIIMDNYYVNEEGTGYGEKSIDSTTSKWLINELSKNDGYDIVYLQHWGMCPTKKLRTDKNESAWVENVGNSTVNYKLWQLLLARKKKQSGTFTDMFGNSYDFDFSSCKNELLCTLHGHNHLEFYSIQDGLTAYGADWFGNSAGTFLLIDRKNNKLKVFKFNNTSVDDILELSI